MKEHNLFLLDIDNVLNTDEHIRRVNRDAGIETRQDFEEYFHANPGAYLQPEYVERLDECLNDFSPDPYIVLCSSWQTSFSPEGLTELLEEYGFGHRVRERTHDYFIAPSSTRLEEVRATIRSIDPDRLVILDDSYAYKSRDYRPDYCFENHHVQPEDGLTEENVKALHELWTVEFEYEPPSTPEPPWKKYDEVDNPGEQHDEDGPDDPNVTIKIGDIEI